jgi:hypothetical protein|tara:strand:- start:9592 stop:10044 length:453 start_codon:yes stop_codon:yes gene_type:complete
MFSYLTEHDKIENPTPTKLGYSSNNIYDGFPPLMEDGRTITASHQPEAVLNNYLLKDTGINSNWEYRRYLTNNSTQIVSQNRLSSMNDIGYVKRYEDIISNFTTPKIQHSYVETEPQKSDLKNIYLSREQLNSKLVAPEMTQYELLKLMK